MSATLASHGYHFAPALFQRKHMAALGRYLLALADGGRDAFVPDPTIPSSLRRHGAGDLPMNAVSDRVQPFVERIVGRRLRPTNTFARIYYTGAELVPHKDRGHCEISCSITVECQADELWPLWVSNPAIGAEAALPIDVGDIGFYFGTELVHWRRPFTGRRWTQLLLHYVHADLPDERGLGR